MSRSTIITKTGKTAAKAAAVSSETRSRADLSSRRWLSTADEILQVLERADEIQVFAQATASTPPLVIWTRRSHPDTLQTLKDSTPLSASQGGKPITHGWLVMTNRGRSYVAGYDFYNGVLVAGPDQAVAVGGTVRQRLLNLFREASVKRAGGRML